MKVIEITEIEVKAALDVAKSEEVKNVLVALFCKGEKKPTPTLDDYTTIRSYEDACAALKCSPIDEKALRSAGVRKGIIALIKLETISQALWGKNYQPKPDASGNSRVYLPRFAFWSGREIKEKEGRVYIPIIDALNNLAGFGFASTSYAPSYTDAYVGSRLWQESREKAKYFGQQFIELWFDYLMFNVKKVQE